jgi:4-aminobutyrate aminotransferase-like enzyme
MARSQSPGESLKVLDLLRQYESRNVTFIEADGSWPAVWERAKGVQVWDAHGKRYLDLTAGFGVAAAGHANPRVVKAGRAQMGRLLHAMGDVHPHAAKAQLARELSRITFERWLSKPDAATTDVTRRPSHRSPSLSRLLPSATRGFNPRAKTIFCNSGFEAVEAALKTAMLAKRKPGIIAFKDGYHGLGYGTLNATHREHFRALFRSQLRELGHFVSFPTAAADLDQFSDSVRHLFRAASIGAVLVEPVQVRGGINLPPLEFLPLLRRLCDEHEALLIFDEIYTGFGRTGKWFACEHSSTVPDIICLGKALTGGFPVSACTGRADVMDAWPPSSGEAIHTSTFLGHPVGCAMALAQIQEIRDRLLVRRSAKLGRALVESLQSELPKCRLRLLVRGLGLLVGIEVRRPDGSPATNEVLETVKAMLHRGFILLPEGEHANVIGFTPPLVISENQLKTTVRTLGEILAARYPGSNRSPGADLYAEGRLLT